MVKVKKLMEFQAARIFFCIKGRAYYCSLKFLMQVLQNKSQDDTQSFAYANFLRLWKNNRGSRKL